MSDYHSFINNKRAVMADEGIDIDQSRLNPRLKPWQKDIVQWALRRGRAALFEDCGLGKTFQQLAWAENVAKHTRGQVLLLCPVAVGVQTCDEAKKFGIDASVGLAADQSECQHDVNVTNYERLHLFDTGKFSGVVLDESSILKSYAGKTKGMLCDLFSQYRYRLACTATPAPNDQMELGNHSEFLGVMNGSEMLSRWFINDGKETGTYRLRGHARKDFWRWVSSWACAINKPSILGYEDEGYALPKLTLHEHECGGEAWFGLDNKKLSATDVYASKSRTLNQRCGIAADMVNRDDDYWVVWCDTDEESSLLTKLIRDAVEVKGSHKPELKAERLASFSRGECRVMITKPDIGGFGMNWQHCNKMTYFANYSFERWYQAIRRLWRFGQEREVHVHFIQSLEEHGLARTLKRKQDSFDEMASEMALAMREGMMEAIYGKVTLRPYEADKAIKLPEWMTSA